jgi:Tol biopolymer transport system component
MKNKRSGKISSGDSTLKGKKVIQILLLSSILFPSLGYAQFWHVFPPLAKEKSMSVGFSNDEKKVFYLSNDGGVANIWSVTIADKYGRIIAGPNNPPMQVTKFTDRGIVRMFHLLNFPEILYMRLTNNGKDYHIYRIKDDGTGEPQDLTSGGDGVTSEIIGASYNGRFVYYTENAVNHDKVDTYRYDTQQFTTDLVFPNDKDYRVLAWSRDHGRLLVEDPHAGDLLMFDISSTDRAPLLKPANGPFIDALMDPTNHKLIVVEKEGDQNVEREIDLDSKVSNIIATGNINWVDYSPNGKYEVVDNGGIWSIKEVASGAEVMLPAGAHSIEIAPKETMLLYTIAQGNNGSKLFLYDIGKKASIELAAMK